MSLKPAIGKKWLDLYGDHCFAHDHVVVNGRPQKPPKYYDRWLELKNPSLLESVKQKRKLLSTPLTPEASRARAINARARSSLQKKSV